MYGLHGFAQSGNAYKVALLLQALRQPTTHSASSGNEPTIADMSMCGYLYFPPEESGYDIEKQYPAMAKWLERLKQLPGWKPPYEMQPGERVPPRW